MFYLLQDEIFTADIIGLKGVSATLWPLRTLRVRHAVHGRKRISLKAVSPSRGLKAPKEPSINRDLKEIYLVINIFFLIWH